MASMDVRSDQQRELIRQWGLQSWAEPCEAISFRRTGFRLEQFSGRVEFGTLPWWGRIGIVLASPVLLAYGVIRHSLDDAGVTTRDSDTTPKPGKILVNGTTDNTAATSIIDDVKRAPRNVWLVCATTKVAIVAPARGSRSQPRVVWETDETATIRYNNDAPDGIEIIWPERGRAFFYPTDNEREVLTNFLCGTGQRN